MRRLSFLLAALPLAVAALLLLAPWGNRTAKAEGTHWDYVISNIATMTWNTTVSLAVTNTTNVGTNYGGTWIGTNFVITNVDSGATAVNTTTFTNEGNAPEDFVFISTNLGGTTNAIWNYWLETNTTGISGKTITIAGITPGGVLELFFKTTVPMTETNGTTNVFQLLASNSNAMASGATTYVGNNTSNYGGSMGANGAGVGTVWMTERGGTAGDTNWVVVVKAATMSLVKYITVQNPAPYAAIAPPVPGALITVELIYANYGTSTAMGVTIGDMFYINRLDFKDDSLQYNANTNLGYNGVGFVHLTTNANDGDAGAFLGASDSNVYFCPGTGGNSPGTGGNVNATVNGAFFYRLLLK